MMSRVGLDYRTMQLADFLSDSVVHYQIQYNHEIA